MPAMEMLTGIVTGVGTTFTGLTMQDSDSLTIKNGAPQQPDGWAAYLLNTWANFQGADGILRIRGSKMHDQTQGIRLRPTLDMSSPLLPFTPFPQRLFPQDTLTVDAQGSATCGDIETAHLLLYYPDLSGNVMRLFSPDEVLPRIRDIITVENTIATGTAGALASEALNAEFDLLKANTDYAILGYQVQQETEDQDFGAFFWEAPDFANLRIGVPGAAHRGGAMWSKDWFIRISRGYGLPLIPVFASPNIGNVSVGAYTNELGEDPTIETILGRLAVAPETQSGLK